MFPLKINNDKQLTLWKTLGIVIILILTLFIMIGIYTLSWFILGNLFIAAFHITFEWTFFKAFVIALIYGYFNPWKIEVNRIKGDDTNEER